MMLLCVWAAWPMGAGIPVTTLFVWSAWVLLLPTPYNLRGMKPYTFRGKVVRHFSLIPRRVGTGICKLQRRVYALHIGTMSKRQAFCAQAQQIMAQKVLFVSILICLFLAVFIPIYFGYGICISFDPVVITTQYTRSRMPQFCGKYVEFFTQPKRPIIVWSGQC